MTEGGLLLATSGAVYTRIDTESIPMVFKTILSKVTPYPIVHSCIPQCPGYSPYTSNGSLSTGRSQHRMSESVPALKQVTPVLLMTTLSTAPRWPLRVCTGSTSTRAFLWMGCGEGG